MPDRLPASLGRCLLTLSVLLTTACTPGSEKSLRKADAHYLAGAYDNAEIEYRNTLKADPGNIRAVVQLGLIFADEGRPMEAFPLLNRARETQPDNLEVRVRLARLQLSGRALPAARTELRYVLDRKPAHRDAPLLLAETVQQPSDLPEIRDYLGKLSSAGTAPVLVALALLELREQHLPQAEALLQSAQGLDANLPTVHAVLAMSAQLRHNAAGTETALATTWKLAGPREPQKLLYPRYKLQTGDIAGARRLLTELVTQTPDFLPPLMLLAEIATKEKKTDEALELLGKILERDQLNLPALVLEVRLLLVKNEADKAMTKLEKLLKFQPKNPEFHYLLALAHLARQDSAKALASLNQAVELAPDHADAVLLLSETLLKKGDIPKALPLLKNLVAKKPDLIPAKMLLGRAQAARGETAEALALFQSVAAAAPQDANLLLPVAQIFRFQKNYGEARQVLLRALALAPDSIPVAEHLIDLDLIEGRQDQARQRAEALLQKAPAETATHLLMTKVELAAKNYPAAETHLLRSIELQPNQSTAYHLLANLYSETKQEAKAIDQLEELAQREPRNLSFPMRIALLAERLQDYPRARAAYEKVLTLNPKFGPALNNLAYLLAAYLNETDRALPYAQKAREQFPLDPNVSDTLAWIYFKQGQYDSARNLLLEIATKSSEDPVAQYHLGLAHYMTGNLAAARTALQRALQLKPLMPEAAEINRRLAVLDIDGNSAGPAARAALEKSLAEDPRDPVTLTLLASLHAQGVELDLAEQRAQAALAINSRYLQASLVRIRVLLARQQAAPALDLAKATYKLHPDDPTVSHQLGRLAFQSGDYVWAASLLQDSARRLSDQPAVLSDHAQAAYSVGRVTETEEVFRSLQKNFPAAPEVALAAQYLELIALAREPSAAGAAAIERSLQAKPGFVPALIARAALAEKNLDLPGAHQAYEQALATYPEFLPAKRNLALLAAAADQDEPKAYDRANQAREAYPSDAELTRALGILACRKGEFSRAANLLKESQLKLGEQSRALYFLGLAQTRLKDAAARSTLQRALELGLPATIAAEARKLLAELK